LIKRSRERLGEFIARLALPRATGRVEAGNTKSEILRVAQEEHADLIVLGSRERHGLAILMNFTEDTVLHAAHCDVLAVRLK
jgi:universal stress protein A